VPHGWKVPVGTFRQDVTFNLFIAKESNKIMDLPFIANLSNVDLIILIGAGIVFLVMAYMIFKQIMKAIIIGAISASIPVVLYLLGFDIGLDDHNEDNNLADKAGAQEACQPAQRERGEAWGFQPQGREEGCQREGERKILTFEQPPLFIPH